MPTVADVLGLLERYAPLELAAGWDNVGLLLGDREYLELEGHGGLETAILLVRTTPLSAEEIADLAREVGRLPPARLENPREFACLELAPGEARAHHCEPPRITRDLSDRARAADDAAEKLMLRLQPHAELIKAVRFAHLGK